jgi:hypothetical protein
LGRVEVELDRDWDVLFLLLVGFVARGGVAAADGEPVAEDEDVVADRNDFFLEEDRQESDRNRS